MQSAAEGRAPPTGAATAPRRPRLLALHGWRTSAAVLAQQLQRSGLGTALEEVAELDYLNGPHPARGPPTPDVQRAFQPPFFEWWDAVQDAASVAKVVRYEGVQETMSLIRAELHRAAASGRPVGGLVGFSQGAMLAGLVMALQERSQAGFQDVPPLRCAVLIGGGLIRDPAFGYLYAGGCDNGGSGGGHSSSSSSSSSSTVAQDAAQVPPLSTGVPVASATATQRPLTPPPPPQLTQPQTPLFSSPSCHLIGSADLLRHNSEKLVRAFRQPLVLRHDQGHVVPRLNWEQRRQLTDFLRANLVPTNAPH
ncbi:hypothetical protein Vafri_8941 [Volvox africanus]|uniref:Serine hydrolase domain-containing protein n=1 Tax=Volvox africanus TaxID=51714 RepID=A0A8J4B441_9CHLO|nr:hypothetical protein Vafri_8941 [Volvox africanus]